MKSFNKLVAIAAFVPVVAISSTAFAGSVGQLGGGNTYQVKDLTQNTSYSSNVTAACGDTVEYSVELGNTGYGTLSDINVKATLPQSGGVSTMTATTNLGGISGATDTATVSLPSGATQTLVSGSTLLYGSSDNVLKTLPDTITSGVDIGSLNGSTTEFLNFKVNVSCPVTVTPVYTCDELTVTPGENKTVTINALKTTAQNGATFNNATINWGDGSATTTAANVVNATHTYSANGSYTITATANFTVNGQAQSATSNACKQVVTYNSTTPPTVTPPATTTSTPTQLVNTGAGDTIGIFAAVAAISTIAYRFVLGRRLSRQ